MAKSYPAIEKHFEILSALETENDTEKIKKLCIKDIDLLPSFKEETKRRGDDMAKQALDYDKKLGLQVHPFSYYQERNSVSYNIPRFPTFKTLVIIYEQEKDYESAIAVCKRAIAEGQERDGTKSGMTGRLERLLKKANSNAP